MTEISVPDPYGDELETCPFIGCGAAPTLVTEPAAPGPTAGRAATVKRIPRHATGGNEWFGECPASLLEWPLGGAAWRNLRLEGKAFAKMHDERARKTPPPTSGQPGHSRAARPDARSRGPFWRTTEGRTHGPGRNFNQNVMRPDNEEGEQ